jgi:hypothetical protein
MKMFHFMKWGTLLSREEYCGRGPSRARSFTHHTVLTNPAHLLVDDFIVSPFAAGYLQKATIKALKFVEIQI